MDKTQYQRKGLTRRLMALIEDSEPLRCQPSRLAGQVVACSAGWGAQCNYTVAETVSPCVHSLRSTAFVLKLTFLISYTLGVAFLLCGILKVPPVELQTA